MTALQSTIEIIADEVKTQWWSRTPYRHVEVCVRIDNTGDAEAENVEFEILFPEELIFDLRGST